MDSSRSSIFDTLRSLLDKQVLVLDGAMGTMIQRYKLSEADWRGERFQRSSQGSQGEQRRPDPRRAPT